MKKSLVLSLAAVLIFGLMGFGFAMWSDTVSVSASVSTGDVAVGIADVGTNDNILTTDILGGTATNTEDGVADAMTLGGDPQVAPGVNSEGKNVASFVSVNTGDVDFTLDGVDYYSSITETITNAYPYYAPTTQFKIASNGSIPVKLDKIHVEPATGDLDLESLGYSWVVTKPDGTSVDGEGIDALVAALANFQLHKGDVITVDLTVSFPQTTPQGASGGLTLTVHAAQWNEAGQDDPNSNIF